MTKDEIFKKLDCLDLDKEEYIVINDASLVVQDIIEETEDINLCCSDEYYRSIDWQTKKEEWKEFSSKVNQVIGGVLFEN